MNKAWQDWLQWVGSIILIPLIALIGFTVFESKSQIAVLQSRMNSDHELLVKMYEKQEAQGNLLIRAVTKLESLESANDG